MLLCRIFVRLEAETKGIIHWCADSDTSKVPASDIFAVSFKFVYALIIQNDKCRTQFCRAVNSSYTRKHGEIPSITTQQDNNRLNESFGSLSISLFTTATLVPVCARLKVEVKNLDISADWVKTQIQIKVKYKYMAQGSSHRWRLSCRWSGGEYCSQLCDCIARLLLSQNPVCHLYACIGLLERFWGNRETNHISTCQVLYL